MYAVELSGLHIGTDMAYIKRYTYKGEDKEKVVQIYDIRRINHADFNRVQVFARLKSHGYGYDWHNLKLDDELEIINGD